MTDRPMPPVEVMRAALRAIEEGWSFDRIDNEIAPLLRAAIKRHDRIYPGDDVVIATLPWKWDGTGRS